MSGVKGRAMPWLQTKRVIAARTRVRNRCAHIDSAGARVARTLLTVPWRVHFEFAGGFYSVLGRLESFDRTGY